MVIDMPDSSGLVIFDDPSPLTVDDSFWATLSHLSTTSSPNFNSSFCPENPNFSALSPLYDLPHPSEALEFYNLAQFAHNGTLDTRSAFGTDHIDLPTTFHDAFAKLSVQHPIDPFYRINRTLKHLSLHLPPPPATLKYLSITKPSDPATFLSPTPPHSRTWNMRRNFDTMTAEMERESRGEFPIQEEEDWLRMMLGDRLGTPETGGEKVAASGAREEAAPGCEKRTCEGV